MPQSYISPRFSAIDSNGRPLVGGKLYTYINGTTTPQVTYQDAGGLAANTNPVILDARGEAVIFLTDGVVYTFVLKDADDALIWSQDSISGAQTSSGGITPVTVLPGSDIGPVYMPGQGIFYWNGTQYVSDFQGGFSGGGFSFKNKIINGDFRVWQRGTSIGPITSASSNPYVSDRWRATISGSSSITVTQQMASSDYGQARTGAFTARVTSNAAESPAAGDKNRLSQAVEGQNLLSFAMGTLWGGSFTLSFWVKASIVGTYCVAFLNSGSPSYRAYVANFSIGAANVWELKRITVPIDSSGLANWVRDTGLGMQVIFDLGSGSNYEGAVNTWLSTETTRTTGAVRLVGTNAATFEVGQVQLEMGTQQTPFDDRPYEVEFDLCRRYFWRAPNSSYMWSGNTTSGITYYASCLLPVTMRATPTVSGTTSNGESGFPTSFAGASPQTANTVVVSKVANATASGSFYYAGFDVTAEY
ncbi:hypothetical protein ELS24_10290 [Achromobacter spanius]|uniref:hypothetical protein n=1 Tax=Achromobacter spanius TaxID=217203 RepID=UPI000F8FB03B|nr:hypothetical protein [Achromobacter spanius]AZS78799.1 hypothetical protein ELS24_10290 [Achromobacter spanius]